MKHATVVHQTRVCGTSIIWKTRTIYPLLRSGSGLPSRKRSGKIWVTGCVASTEYAGVHDARLAAPQLRGEYDFSATFRLVLCIPDAPKGLQGPNHFISKARLLVSASIISESGPTRGG